MKEEIPGVGQSNDPPYKILLVARWDSIHTSRWIGQFDPAKFRIFLFPSIYGGFCRSELVEYVAPLGVLSFFEWLFRLRNRRGSHVVSGPLAHGFRRVVRDLFPNRGSRLLSRIISRVKPDLVHAMEIQNAGYLVARIQPLIGSVMPPLLVTNLGSDISVYGHLKDHRTRIEEVLSIASFYSCECSRDVELAKNFGFDGHVFEPFPNAGGLEINRLRQEFPWVRPSERRSIVVKCRGGWAGRSMFALVALRNLRSLLEGYTIVLLSVDEGGPEWLAGCLLREKYGVNVEIHTTELPHKRILGILASSRISISLSLGDGICTTLLEAMAMGALPIQSTTACTKEWVEHLRNACLVDPEDVPAIEEAVKIAIAEDSFIDNAAIENERIINSGASKREGVRRSSEMYITAMSPRAKKGIS